MVVLDKHSLVINSQSPELFRYSLIQKLSRNFVSIGINAKCRECAVMRMTVDALFFETDFNYSSVMLPSFIFVMFVYEIALCVVQNNKSKLTFRKTENMQMRHSVSFVAGKRNPLKSNNFSCIYSNLPNTCS